MLLKMAYRDRASLVWSHYFLLRVARRQDWLAFYSFARAKRSQSEYAFVTPAGYVPVL